MYTVPIQTLDLLTLSSKWFSSYLTDRTHYVSLSNHCSAFTHVHPGVPLGSVLRPIPFTMYIKPLSAIIDSHSITHHSFADGLELQMSAPPDRISELLHSMQSCISDVKAWETANMLKLNDNKTELMLVTSRRTKQLHSLPTSITIGNAEIPLKKSVKNLGITLHYITLAPAHTPCLFSIDLHTVWQHLVIVHFLLLLLLSGTLFQMMSGVSRHCHHLSHVWRHTCFVQFTKTELYPWSLYICAWFGHVMALLMVFLKIHWCAWKKITLDCHLT